MENYCSFLQKDDEFFGNQNFIEKDNPGLMVCVVGS